MSDMVLFAVFPYVAVVLENDEDRRRDQDARRRRAVRLEHARVKRERLLAETKERG